MTSSAEVIRNMATKLDYTNTLFLIWEFLEQHEGMNRNVGAVVKKQKNSTVIEGVMICECIQKSRKRSRSHKNQDNFTYAGLQMLAIGRQNNSPLM